MHDHRSMKTITINIQSYINVPHCDRVFIAYNGFFRNASNHPLFLFKNYGTGRLTSMGRSSNSHPSMPMGYQWMAV